MTNHTSVSRRIHAIASDPSRYFSSVLSLEAAQRCVFAEFAEVQVRECQGAQWLSERKRRSYWGPRHVFALAFRLILIVLHLALHIIEVFQQK